MELVAEYSVITVSFVGVKIVTAGTVESVVNVKLLFELLQIDEFKGVSKNIDIAKGKYKLPETIKEGVKQIKRELAWRREKR